MTSQRIAKQIADAEEDDDLDYEERLKILKRTTDVKPEDVYQY